MARAHPSASALFQGRQGLRGCLSLRARAVQGGSMPLQDRSTSLQHGHAAAARPSASQSHDLQPRSRKAFSLAVARPSASQSQGPQPR
eukprot:6182835-Pleurochrysis_carterae.AAC.2